MFNSYKFSRFSLVWFSQITVSTFILEHNFIYQQKTWDKLLQIRPTEYVGLYISKYRKLKLHKTWWSVITLLGYMRQTLINTFSDVIIQKETNFKVTDLL